MHIDNMWAAKPGHRRLKNLDPHQQGSLSCGRRPAAGLLHRNYIGMRPFEGIVAGNSCRSQMQIRLEALLAWADSCSLGWPLRPLGVVLHRCRHADAGDAMQRRR